MAYIKTTVSDYGDNVSFAKALQSFFINNEVAPFKLISEDLTLSNPVFTVERNNLNLQFKIDIGSPATSTEITISSKKANGEYVLNRAIAKQHMENGSSNPCNRELQLLLIKNKDTIVLQIGAWDDVSASRGTTIIDTVLDNGINLIGVGEYSISETTIYFNEVESQNVYAVRPFHTGSNDETTLLLSNQLAVNGNNGVYCGDALGLISAGGAKQFGYYVTALNTYYGLLADVCIPLGDRIDYVVSDTTE